MFCNQCGANNAEDSNFCTQCGAALEQLTDSHNSLSEDTDFSPVENWLETEPGLSQAPISEDDENNLLVKGFVALGGFFYLGYLLLGLFQMAAIMSGLVSWWDVPAFLAFFVALFVAYIPILGTIVGIVGAHDAWGWGWPMAIGLFFGPLILIYVIASIQSALSRN